MKKAILSAMSLLFGSVVFSQNVGIGTNTPNTSAVLDITDSTKGILIPRMTLSQRNAIQNPAEGLMVYQQDGLRGFWYFENGIWKCIADNTTEFNRSKNQQTLIYTISGF